MTAQIAILNRYGAAVASDTAVSYRWARGTKVFNTEEKLYCISKNPPVALMGYGKGNICNIQFDVLAKEYALALESKQFENLENYTDGFI